MVVSRLFRRTKAVLKQTPLRPLARWSRFWARVAVSPAFRAREIAWWREYRSWRRQCGDGFRASLVKGDRGRAPKALVVAKGTPNGAKIELFLIKGLELAGFVPVVLTDRSLVKYYRIAGVTEFVYWEDFSDPADGDGAANAVASAATLKALLELVHAGARVGRFAVSTVLRYLRVGHLDLDEPRIRRVFTRHLAEGMMRAAASGRILRTVRPTVALFLGNRYTGQSELMDVCAAEGVSVITWFESHRSNALMLKRYDSDNLDQHHASLSARTWRHLQRMPWTASHRQELSRQIEGNYLSGDWYSRGGTQFGKQLVGAEEIRRRLNLHPQKRTVFVFPHIVWDATLFWGQDLFEHYEQWLVATARAASANSHVNWVFKIHPANVVKNAWEGSTQEAAEMRIIRGEIGVLPPHVSVIPASSDINTFSLFEMMDCCVTVRGTIGIEAATLGINVVTAGTGRYDGRGFTIDSATRQEYLDTLARIQDLPPPTSAQRELAERFAWGTFVLRPWSLQTLAIEYERDDKATMRVQLAATSAGELRAAADLAAFADWVANSRDEDFLDARAAWAD